MKTYSEEEISQLIGCEKVVTEPPRKAMAPRRGHRRNDMRLRSKQSDKDFTVFMRINDEFPENFSIGLVHSPKDERGTICLLRFNGPHGGFGWRADMHGSLYHIHRAGPENIEAGKRAEAGGKATRAFASYEQALRHFLRQVNVCEAEELFPGTFQLRLNSNEEQAKR